MELTFLGTSSGSPTRERNVSGVALRDGGSWDLFDCGEATQHRLLDTNLALSKLRRVFISHLHGDHCFGLFGLLGSRSLERAATPVTVYGPPGITEMIEVVLRASSSHIGYPLEIIEVDPTGGVVIDDERERVEALPLAHRVLSFAWSLQQADRPGRFDPNAAEAAGVAPGPLFGQLQRGHTVQLDDGRIVSPTEVMGQGRAGRRVLIAGDNSDPRSLFERTGRLDLAVHEATYTEPVVAHIGGDHGHSTAKRVAVAAEAAGVEALLLTHFSARFARSDAGGTGHTIDEIRDEATPHFSGVLHLANDLDVVRLDPDGNVTVAAT